MKTLKEKINITLDSDIIEKIKKEAGHDEWSVSRFINFVLRDFLKSSDKAEKLFGQLPEK